MRGISLVVFFWFSSFLTFTQIAFSGTKGVLLQSCYRHLLGQGLLFEQKELKPLLIQCVGYSLKNSLLSRTYASSSHRKMLKNTLEVEIHTDTSPSTTEGLGGYPRDWKILHMVRDKNMLLRKIQPRHAPVRQLFEVNDGFLVLEEFSDYPQGQTNLYKIGYDLELQWDAELKVWSMSGSDFYTYIVGIDEETQALVCNTYSQTYWISTKTGRVLRSALLK